MPNNASGRDDFIETSEKDLSAEFLTSCQSLTVLSVALASYGQKTIGQGVAVYEPRFCSDNQCIREFSVTPSKIYLNAYQSKQIQICNNPVYWIGR